MIAWRRWVAACLVSLAASARLAATPPVVSVSGFSVTGSQAALNWTGPTNGWVFTVESRPDLAASSWSPVAGVWPQATNQWTGLAQPGAVARFYRVVAQPAPVDRGRLLSAMVAAVYPAAEINLLASFADVPLVATQSVTVLHLTYATIDPYGAPTIASGALAIPQYTTSPRPLLTYLHGTSFLKSDVPSQLNIEGLLGVAIASAGYLAVLPDYLGLGDSPGFHPYLDAASEASAGVDMLRAARGYFATNGIVENGQFFISGYSQGGHSALALLREVEAHLTNEFPVTACAAGAGPYDLSTTTANAVLTGAPEPDPGNFAYLLAAYQATYGLTNKLSDLLAPPYDKTIPPLFDGLHSIDDVNAAMPADPLLILKPAVLSSLSNNPADPFRAKLHDNDLIRWVPRAPLRLYACSGDMDVPPVNATVAQAAFANLGDPNVSVGDPDPGADHGACAVPAIVAMKNWFDSLLR